MKIKLTTIPILTCSLSLVLDLTLLGLGKSDFNHNETNSQMVLTLGVLLQRPQSQERSFAKLDSDIISWTLVPNIYRSRLNIYPLLIVSVWSVLIPSNNFLNISFCRFIFNVRLKCLLMKEGMVLGRRFFLDQNFPFCAQNSHWIQKFEANLKISYLFQIASWHVKHSMHPFHQCHNRIGSWWVKWQREA